jgi:hypothetical protein
MKPIINKYLTEEQRKDKVNYFGYCRDAINKSLNQKYPIKSEQFIRAEKEFNGIREEYLRMFRPFN